MILLDTNVLSAMMRAEDEPAVERWFNAQPVESVWTTAITVFEARYGLSLLPAGRRRDRLEQAFTIALDEVLGGRILPFDRHAADLTGQLAAERRQRGRPMEVRDLQIAGIAKARKAVLATRNRRHFDGMGLKLVDPWKA